jgi:hypothetical protein
MSSISKWKLLINTFNYPSHCYTHHPHVKQPKCGTRNKTNGFTKNIFLIQLQNTVQFPHCWTADRNLFFIFQNLLVTVFIDPSNHKWQSSQDVSDILFISMVLVTCVTKYQWPRWLISFSRSFTSSQGQINSDLEGKRKFGWKLDTKWIQLFRILSNYDLYLTYLWKVVKMTCILHHSSWLCSLDLVITGPTNYSTFRLSPAP